MIEVAVAVELAVGDSRVIQDLVSVLVHVVHMDIVD
eukprot:CAMPEP_0197040044 /NCGR_PEP_ID=MMETSP1384-20130603/16799_1 /TAXON_ID=29189 /ORGANISM="Ammonia sp." /LENGTH=35 /DNA_ID= /DNA_START= /DNA_END= /DNA_ORIENTATION=